MMKMVIVYSDAGDEWFEEDGESGGYPFGGEYVAVCRFTIENGKIKPEILESAPLPKGHEKGAILYYRSLMAHFLNPQYAKEPRTLPYSPYDKLESPENNPQQWLEAMCEVFHNVSAYEDADESEFRPMSDAIIKKYVN
ncbi:MAG: hypothetical protein HQL01_09410 [Nitrospirae bacterium]|nr:hypothetical protein [Nitrospirota bacterium]